MSRSDVEPVQTLGAAGIRARVQRESRLIARLMKAETAALHAECEALGLPHEDRSPAELRAALFTHHRRTGCRDG